MTFQKQYTTPGTYTVSISANWSGVSSSGQYSGFATQSDTIQVLTSCGPVIASGPSPTNETVLAGGTAQFTVTVTSPYPVSYQWYLNSNFPIIGPILSTLTLPDVGTNESGKYDVIVSNTYGSVTSSFATLAVYPHRFIINPFPGPIRLQFSGLPYSTNIIEAATNLAPPILWIPISTNVAGPDGTLQFTGHKRGQLPYTVLSPLDAVAPAIG